MLRVFLVLLLVAVSTWYFYLQHNDNHASATMASEGIVNAWVEVGPNAQAVARAIVTSTTCPSIIVNSQAMPMQERAAPTDDSSFPGRVCELNIPSQAQVTIGEQTLATVAVQPKKIIVFGDTGCRIKVSSKGKAKIQNCNDMANGWPFPQLVQSAAQQHPDLVIHVGDYHYREAQCPPGDGDCSGSVAGDVWPSWSQDFFTPAKPLLAAAPWIFVRGNHETCARAGAGFFRLLDPRALKNSCDDISAPYAINFQNVSFAVLDSSFSDITAANLKTIAPLSVTGGWLLTHRPPWISAEAKFVGDGDEDVVEQEVSIQRHGGGHSGDHSGGDHGNKGGDGSQGDPDPVGGIDNISLVLTGHEHLFRAATFADHRAPQIIAGNGGTLLSDKNSDVVGTSVDGGSTTLESVQTYDNFGYLMLQETAPGSWAADVFDLNGQSAVHCSLGVSAGAPTQLNCAP